MWELRWCMGPFPRPHFIFFLKRKSRWLVSVAMASWCPSRPLIAGDATSVSEVTGWTWFLKFSLGQKSWAHRKFLNVSYLRKGRKYFVTEKRKGDMKKWAPLPIGIHRRYKEMGTMSYWARARQTHPCFCYPNEGSRRLCSGALVVIMEFACLLFPLKRHEIFVLVVLDVHP